MKRVLDLEYALLRESDTSFKYRYERREHEIVQQINRYVGRSGSILDLGTGDGRMINAIKSNFPFSLCVGVDHSEALLNYGMNKFPNINLILADIQCLNFLKDKTFDVVLAVAVTGYLDTIENMLHECHRVLKNDGILIITFPNPFWVWISNIIWFFRKNLQFMMKSHGIVRSCNRAGFNILESKGFLVFPMKMKGALKIEKLFSEAGLDQLLLNRLIIAKKS